MNYFVRELKFALNTLLQAKSFVLAVVVTLGVSLGAFICIAVLGNLVFLEPLPYPEQQRLHLVKGILKNNGNTVMANVNSFPSAREIYGREAEFEEAALLTFETHQLENHPQLPIVMTTFVSPEYFTLLDAPMAVGRALADSDGLDSFNPVAIISHQTWQQYFRGSPDVIGETLQVDERSFRIVGVTSERFSEPNFFNVEFAGTDVWLPWNFHSGDEQARNDWGSITPTTTVVARLGQNVTPPQVTQTVSDGLNRAFLDNMVMPGGQQLPFSMSVELTPIEEVILGDSRSTVTLLFAGALTLLLISASNVMNLMLSRTIQKQRQLTIKAVVGANRRHLFQAILAENLVLMAGVSLLAIVVASYGFGALRDMASDYLPRLGELSLNGRFVFLTLILALLLALFFSYVSTRIVDYKKLQSGIQSSGKGGGLQISATVRAALIVTQVCLVGLLIAANLSVLKGATDVMFRSVGFETENLSYFGLNFRGGDLSVEAREQLTLNIRDALARQPQVEMVAASTSEPTRPSNGGTVLRFSDDKNPTNAVMQFVSSNYFGVMQQAMVQGRGFTADEVRDSAPLAIVTRSLANRMYPGESPLNKSLIQSMSTEPYTIVGVVEDLVMPPAVANVVDGIDMNRQALYMPGLSVPTETEFKYMLRTKPNQELPFRQLLSAMSEVDPNLEPWILETAEERSRELLAYESMVAKSTLALTLLSMLLAGVGIYGVLNYNTQLRRFEIGTRMSLGANPANIVKLIMLSNTKPVLLGFVASIVIGIAIYSVARQHIDNYMNLEALPLVAAAASILLVAAIASYLPIHAIVRKWPIHALRG